MCLSRDMTHNKFTTSKDIDSWEIPNIDYERLTFQYIAYKHQPKKRFNIFVHKHKHKHNIQV